MNITRSIILLLLLLCFCESCNLQTNRESFFEDIFLISKIEFKNTSFKNIYFETIKRDLDFENNDTIINSFNIKVNFTIDLSSFESIKNSIYKDILKITRKTEIEFSNYYKNFFTKIGMLLIQNIYNKDTELDIYSIDCYRDNYYNLINKYFGININEEHISGLLKEEFDYIEDISIDETTAIALLFRQIKTVNKLLIG